MVHKSVQHVVIGGWTTIGKRCLRFILTYPTGVGTARFKNSRREKAYYGNIGDETKLSVNFVTVSRATGEVSSRVGNNRLFQACTYVAHNWYRWQYAIKE